MSAVFDPASPLDAIRAAWADFWPVAAWVLFALAVIAVLVATGYAIAAATTLMVEFRSYRVGRSTIREEGP